MPSVRFMISTYSCLGLLLLWTFWVDAGLPARSPRPPLMFQFADWDS